MTDVPTERELKYALAAVIDPADISFAELGLACAPVDVIELAATYWDTQDLRLLRENYAVRHRTPEGWTLKYDGTAEGAMLVRSEIECPGGPEAIPASLAKLLGSRADGLLPVVSFTTTRHRYHLEDEKGVAAELVVDEVNVPGGNPESYVEMEIEMKREDSRLEEELADSLERAGFALSRISKYEHALLLLGKLSAPLHEDPMPGPGSGARAL